MASIPRLAEAKIRMPQITHIQVEYSRPLVKIHIYHLGFLKTFIALSVHSNIIFPPGRSVYKKNHAQIQWHRSIFCRWPAGIERAVSGVESESGKLIASVNLTGKASLCTIANEFEQRRKGSLSEVCRVQSHRFFLKSGIAPVYGDLILKLLLFRPLAQSVPFRYRVILVSPPHPAAC